MGLLFIPITMLSLSTLKGRQIGEGAAFTGMMRQLGGSFGVAIISTYMSRKIMVHRADLVGKLDVNNPSLQNKITALQQGFIGKGLTPDVAMKSAYKAIDYTVTKQAAILSYMDAFLFIGVIFIFCIPFVLLVRGKKNKSMNVAEAMH